MCIRGSEGSLAIRRPARHIPRSTIHTHIDRISGVGWVAESTDHDYADAQSRGHSVTLLASESSGAISPTFDFCLRALDREARAPGATDHTRYGESRASPRQFYAHHLATISHAIVAADAMTILHTADAMSVDLVATPRVHARA